MQLIAVSKKHHDDEAMRQRGGPGATNASRRPNPASKMPPCRPVFMDLFPIHSHPPTMQCRVTPLEIPGQFLLSDCIHPNFLKQAPQGQIIWQNDPNYEITELLGCGVYGTVCRGRNRATGQVVAIKRIYMAQVCSGACSLDLLPLSDSFFCRTTCARNPKNACVYCAK